MQRPAAAPFAKPIAVPPDGEHVAVVEQTIQDRGCHDRIAKYRAPLTDGLPAISRTCALSIDGCALKSKPARSRAKGKRTRPQLMSMRRWSRWAISRSQNSASHNPDEVAVLVE